MRFEPKPMVNWYDVKQLAATGLKALISTLFGNFADKREIQAALDPEGNFHDFSGLEDECWIDYVSDLGDGFNSTYTMAHLMARESLSVNGITIMRCNMLIMGGDEVYPTPEIEEYRDRLRGPYNAAFPWKENDTERPALFAIPGNHDWYDGCANFIKLFCQGRALGNWLTRQKRSYFAIKLPHQYWLLGIDVQLKSDIDNPQLLYFKKIAREEIQSGDKVILCTAEPSWVYESFHKKINSYERLNFFIERIIYGKATDYEEKNKQVFLQTILTGDLHHYARYKHHHERGITQLITAGGGGAFLHPTHMLTEEIGLEDQTQATKKCAFPSAGNSQRLSFLNLLFPFYSPSLTFFMGIFHPLTSWFLQSGNLAGSTFMERVSQLPFLNADPWSFITISVESIRHSPSIIVLNLILFFGILFFTDNETRRGGRNYVTGIPHAVLQLLNFYLLVWAFSRFNLTTLGLEVTQVHQVLLFSAEMIILGGLVSGFIFGIYLLISTLLLKNHANEAFSSLRWEGYKNFLRIHISRNGLTIYPIGVEKVTRNWKNTGTKDHPRFEGDTVHYQLIENPITIQS